jgi:hypothetical protein
LRAGAVDQNWILTPCAGHVLKHYNFIWWWWWYIVGSLVAWLLLRILHAASMITKIPPQHYLMFHATFVSQDEMLE